MIVNCKCYQFLTMDKYMYKRQSGCILIINVKMYTCMIKVLFDNINGTVQYSTASFWDTLLIAFSVKCVRHGQRSNIKV